jgi:uncharacterized membrane protein
VSALVAGLVIFLGVHSIRIVADAWRARQMARFGELAWKGVYSVASLAGLALTIWGYGLARGDALALWAPPTWTGHVSALLTLPAFVLIAAAHVPRTNIKAKLGHPMVLGVKLWALAHLISNGRLEDVVLFGSFLIWAILDFRAARMRDRSAGIRYPDGSAIRDGAALVLGVAAWAAFALYLHAWLIGVSPVA